MQSPLVIDYSRLQPSLCIDTDALLVIAKKIDASLYSHIAVFSSDDISFKVAQQISFEVYKEIVSIEESNLSISLTSGRCGSSSALASGCHILFIIARINELNINNILTTLSNVRTELSCSISGIINLNHSLDINDPKHQQLMSYPNFTSVEGTVNKSIMGNEKESRATQLNGTDQNQSATVFQDFKHPLFFVSQIESNSPGEDRYCAQFSLPKSPSTASYQSYAVIDGHGGFLAADLTSEHLLTFIMSAIVSQGLLECPDHDRVIAIINKAFCELDNIILSTAIDHISKLNSRSNSLPTAEYFKQKEALMRPGCCAVIAIVIGNQLFLGNVGDCRAVLFSKRDGILSEPPAMPPSPSGGVAGFGSPTRFSPASMYVNSSNAVASSPQSTQWIVQSNSWDASNYHRPSPLLIHDLQDIANKKSDYSTVETSSQSQAALIAAANLAVIQPLNSSAAEAFYDHMPKPLITFYSYERHKTYLSGSLLGRHSIPVNHLDIGGEYYYCTKGTHTVSGLTLDHCCHVQEERESIARMTKDPNPLRPSLQGKRLHGRFAPDRVAGSLAVTRALGDGYLKRKELSPAGMDEYLPYITCHPTIYTKEITSSDIALILASDGLWNFVNAKECVDILSECLPLLAPPEKGEDLRLQESYRNQLYQEPNAWHTSSSDDHTFKRLNSHHPKPYSEIDSNANYDNKSSSNKISGCDNSHSSSSSSSSSEKVEGYLPYISLNFNEVARNSINLFENYSQIQQRKRSYGSMMGSATVTASSSYAGDGVQAQAQAQAQTQALNESEHSANCPSPSAALLHQCLINASASARIDIHTFAKLDLSSGRRSLCDDITVLVVPFHTQ